MHEPLTSVNDFDAVVHMYRPRVFRFALASLRDRDAAETVTQDCFLNAYKGRDRYRGDASVQTWLMQIAVNLIRDAARSRRFQFWKRATASTITAEDASQYVLDAGMSPEERVSAAQQVRAIWGTLDDLSDRQRTVFLLHFVEEMSATEIEAATAIPKGAVKVHLFRAVRAIRKRLEHS